MMVTPDGEPQAIGPIIGEFGVWAVPLPQLTVLIGIVLLTLALWAGRRRSKKRMEAMLEEAREAGRQEIQPS